MSTNDETKPPNPEKKKSRFSDKILGKVEQATRWAWSESENPIARASMDWFTQYNLQSKNNGNGSHHSALPSPTHIRLLKVAPGQAGDPVQTMLHVVDLNSRPDFIALSYSWTKDVSLTQSTVEYAHSKLGDAAKALKIGLEKDSSKADSHKPDLKVIFCNGKRMDVMPNLYECLLQLRQCAPGNYWIDAVCIDQSNTGERGAQIQMMSDIYTAASAVTIWLGYCPQLLSSGIKRLEELKGRFLDQEEAGISGRESSSSSTAMSTLGAAYLLSRRWFRRLWVMQEFCLARRLNIQLGEHRISPETITGSIESIKSWDDEEVKVFLKPVSDVVMPTIKLIPSFFEARRSFQGGMKWSIEEWLRLAHGRRTTDPRDFVAAGLGLIRPDSLAIDASVQLQGDSTTPALWAYLRAAPDSSLREVMLNLAACLLTQSRSVFLLSLASCGENPELPSWVPDLHHEWKMPEPLAFQKDLDLASWTTSLANPKISRDGRRLYLDAARLGVVRHVNGKGALRTSPSSPSRLLVMLEFLIKIPPAYRTGESGLEALIKTMLLGRQVDVDLLPGFAHMLHAKYVEEQRKLLGVMKRHNIHHHKAKSPSTRKDGSPCRPDNGPQRYYLRELAKEDGEYCPTPEQARSIAARLEEVWKRLKSIYPNQPWPDPDAKSSSEPGQGGLDEDMADRSMKILAQTAGMGQKILFLTEEGLLGSGPHWMKQGDVVMLVESGYVPYLFHPAEDDLKEIAGGLEKKLEERDFDPVPASHHLIPGMALKESEQTAIWQAQLEEVRRRMGTEGDALALKGEVYVHGVMHGEALDEPYELERIAIV